MKTYRARLNKDVKGVYGISLVHDPAMEGDFLKFGKQEEVKFAQVDTEKRLLMGLVLEPNKLIYRNQGGREFQVFFSEQDIEDVAYNFQSQSYQKNSTIEHDGNNVEGLTFVETWVVKDTFKDQSANYGMSYPVGSWVAMMKVENDEVWNDYVKTGKVKGFSIDAFMELEEVNINQVNKVNMSKQKEEAKSFVSDFLSYFKLGFSELKKEDEKEEDKEEVKTEDVKEDPKEDEKPKEEPKSEEPKEDEKVDLSKQMETISLELGKAVKEALETSNLELSKKVEALALELKEMKEQPASKKIKSAPSAVDFSKMTPLEKYKYHKENE